MKKQRSDLRALEKNLDSELFYMEANSSLAKKKNSLKQQACFDSHPFQLITSLQAELVILRRASYSLSHKLCLQGESTD